MNRLRLSHFFGLGVGLLCSPARAQFAVPFEHNSGAQEEAERDCPRDVAAWKIWRDEAQKTVNLNQFNSRAQLLSDCSKLPRVLELFMARPDLKACLRPMIDYANALHERSYDEENWISDLEPYPFPSWLRGDHFMDLANKSDAQRRAHFEALAKKHPEARFFTYESQFPEIHGRRFFGVEQKYKNGDRVLINLQLHKDVGAVSQGWYFPADRQKPAMAFRDLGDRLVADKTIQTSCGSCHVNGFVPIHADPAQDPIAPTPRDLKKRGNNWVSTAQVNADYKGSHKTFVSEIVEKLGLPGLGEGDEGERQRIVEACAKEFSAESKARLVKAMDCATCHAPGQKALTLPGSDIAVMEIYLHSIRNGNMPPGINDPQSKRYLKPEEQLKLMDCLEAGYSGSMGGLVEFEGALRKHLLRVACPEK